MTNDENTKPARMQIDGRQVPPWPETIHALRMDLRLAKNLRWHGTMFSVVSSLNMLLHAPAEARGQESPEPSRRPPRPSERWTCADPNTRTRNGRAWVVDRVLRKLAMDVVVFRDPDDRWHGRHPQCVACALGSHTAVVLGRGRVSDRLRRLASLPDPHRPARK